jgi:hypothetical protein
MSTLNKKLKGVNLAMLIIISASLILSVAAVSTAPVIAAKKYSDESMANQDSKDANAEETVLATDGKDDNRDGKDGSDGNDDKGKDGKDANADDTEQATDGNDDKGKDGKDANADDTEQAIGCSSEEVSEDMNTENSEDMNTENSEVTCDDQLASTDALNATTVPTTTAPVSVF